jgi:hypothetical protein
MWAGYFHPIRTQSGSPQLVSEDVVVLENGDRNDGWKDFRDNHSVPEFEEPAAPSKWEFVKVVTQFQDGMGLYQADYRRDGEGGQTYRTGLMVWSLYILQKAGSVWKVVLLDWSVRRLGAAG